MTIDNFPSFYFCARLVKGKISEVMKKLIFFTVFICLTVSLTFGQKGAAVNPAPKKFVPPVRAGEIPDDRRSYGEERILTLGSVGGETYVVVYTMRGDVHRIITAWKVGEDGKKRYQALFDRGNPGDEPAR